MKKANIRAIKPRKFVANKQTVIAAWRMAIKNRPIEESLIFHSDRGVQYACTAFANKLAWYPHVERSMSRKGDCWDNAFFKTIKTELINRNSYKSIERCSNFYL